MLAKGRQELTSDPIGTVRHRSGRGWSPKEEARVLRPGGKGRDTRLAETADAHTAVVSAALQDGWPTLVLPRGRRGRCAQAGRPVSSSEPSGSDRTGGLSPSPASARQIAEAAQGEDGFPNGRRHPRPVVQIAVNPLNGPGRPEWGIRDANRSSASPIEGKIASLGNGPHSGSILGRRGPRPPEEGLSGQHSVMEGHPGASEAGAGEPWLVFSGVLGALSHRT